MITLIDRGNNLFNSKSCSSENIYLLATPCLANYVEIQLSGLLKYLKEDLGTLDKVVKFLEFIGKNPDRFTLKIRTKELGQIILIGKPFYKSVLIEKIGDFSRNQQVYFSDQAEYLKEEISNIGLDVCATVRVDMSSFLSFDQKAEKDFVNFLAESPQRFELFY